MLGGLTYCWIKKLLESSRSVVSILYGCFTRRAAFFPAHVGKDRHGMHMLTANQLPKSLEVRKDEIGRSLMQAGGFQGPLGDDSVQGSADAAGADPGGMRRSLRRPAHLRAPRSCPRR